MISSQYRALGTLLLDLLGKAFISVYIRLIAHIMMFRLSILYKEWYQCQVPEFSQGHPVLSPSHILTSSGPGSRAYGSENDKNGIYVKYLKEHITRHVSVTTLLDTVNRGLIDLD